MFTSPVWRLLFNQRLMVERETPRSSWTSFLGMPRSIAASVFNLRSFEYAFMGSILIQVRYLRKPLLEVRLKGVLRTRVGWELATYQAEVLDRGSSCSLAPSVRRTRNLLTEKSRI